ncbi:MAG: hypothetical protein CSA38_00810 [Flavobacteriales bacterium]|nr:MAG: hypothetical protein CSA38_00810 [Flavobacteriales bacterium]
MVVKAQSSLDIEDIFKMQLFLDKKLTIHSSTKGVVKDNALYQIFSDSAELNIDTLKVNSALYYFIDPFQYYKVDLKNTIQNLSNEDSKIQSLSFFHGLNTIYILAINSETGLTYRLKGFNGNDFLTFLRDFKEMYRKQTGNSVSNNKFIKKYKLPDVDFKCLYKGLRSGNIDIQKYPCLIRCSDPIRVR